MRHDKRYEGLETLDNYELEHRSQDIRGRPLVSASGEKYGIIQDLLVDRNANRVAAVKLDNGKICAVEPLEIHENAVVYGADAESFADTAGDHVESRTDYDNRAGSTGSVDTDEERIPIVEEQLVIGKRAETGRTINVRSRLVSDRVSEDVTLHEEHVTIEHNPINRELSSSEAEAMLIDGKTVSMTERNEEVVVGKKAVVTDEVVVRKEGHDRTEHVEETVRRTEVDVDGELDGVSGNRRGGGLDGDTTTRR
jgi:uncharacterized protein (TIGR02271 family)